MIFSISGVVLIGILLIGISYFIQGKLLTDQLKSQSKEISSSWIKKMDFNTIEKASKLEDITSPEHKELTMLFDKLIEYNPNISQGYIFGTELSGKKGNETSLVSYPTSIWQALQKNGLKVGDMYEQPPVIVDAIKKLKNEKKLQFTTIYKDKLGTWITVLYPITNSNGEVYAYFGVDVDAKNVAKGQNELLIKTSIALLIILILLIFLQYLLLKNSLKPLTNLMSGIDEASQGNLNINLVVRGDEIGQVNKKFNSMINILKGMVTSIRKTSREVDEDADGLYASFEASYEASSNISSSVEGVQELLKSQTLSIRESAVSMEHISQEITSIADSTNEVYKLSENVNDLSEEGKQSTDKVVEQMKRINRNVDNSRISIKELVDASDEISNILQVITNIAHETNLLALNASIEAARVGEHGKGFAVVANEVKKLSEQSSDSVDSIKKVIDNVKNQVEKVFGSMEIIKDDVNEGIQVTETTSEVFGKIYLSIQEVADKLQAVSNSSQQISAGIEESTASIVEISSNTENITNGYDTIVENIQEQEASFKSIKEMATNLNKTSKILAELSDQFTV